MSCIIYDPRVHLALVQIKQSKLMYTIYSSLLFDIICGLMVALKYIFFTIVPVTHNLYYII